MRRPALLIAPAALAFLSAALLAAPPGRGGLDAPATATDSARTVAAGATDEGAYAGSGACQSCHEPEYASWRENLHVQMTRPIAEARVLGDFRSGTEFKDHGRSYAMESRDGRYFISVARSGGPAQKFEVQYTLGARRFQGYLTTLPDGRIYVLPVFWHNESQRWLDYEEITPIPKDSQHDLRQIWNVTCVNCHATNLVRNFRASSNTFATTWTEMGIGCEACHGPGRPHIDDPAHLKIFTMKKVPPREVFDACGYCHGNKTNVFLGFKAGDHYDDFALPFLISEPIPANDPQGEFWPDGRPSRFNRPQALTITGCFQKGEATCTSCHRMHGAQNEHSLKVPIDDKRGGHTRQSDALCTQCHDGPRAAGASAALRSEFSGGRDESSALVRGAPEGRAGGGSLDAHTHHAPESQGSRCINCHMSDVNWRLITRRLDHTFQPPVPEMTARYGAPNACTSCHEDKSPEWAAAAMDAWYGNRTRRQAVVALADTMYRAGSGDAGALPAIAQLAVDRSRGALIRASAAEFAGQLMVRSGAGTPPAPAIFNALVGAANDAEPWVRIAAVRSLGVVEGDPRVFSVLAAHLVDRSRVVRVSAAEALLNLGVAVLDGPPGVALSKAQDEWMESLRTFGDVASDRATLGWLLAARGNAGEGAAELRTAVALDPTAARPHVYLGVIAARDGRFDDAMRSFRAAKSLAPAYPNLDRLIEEAAKRAGKNDRPRP